MNIEATKCAATTRDAWRAQLVSDLSAVRLSIEARGLNPDQPERWAWDPWPDLENAGRYRNAAGGQKSPAPFFDMENAVPMLEAHAFWSEAGTLHHLLILPGDKPGALHWHWHPAGPALGATS